MNAFPPIYRTFGLRQVEAAALATGAPLMERAGLAAARLAQRLLGDRPGSPGRSVLVLAGPGNNGGDALECAVHLKQAYYRVTVVFTGESERLPADARRALDKWLQAGGTLQAELEGDRWDLMIDGLFGIGLSRPLQGRHADLVARINALRCPVLALDIPSGLNADTGAAMGAVVRATHTLTFIALKPGLLTLDGPDHCGQIHCDVLGVDAPSLCVPDGEWINAAVMGARPNRPRNFHKGQAGDVGIIGGAQGMVGAALLAGRAALHTGAGRVFVGCLAEQAPSVDFTQPELMLRPPRQVLGACPVLLLGPGMGTDMAAADLLREALGGTQTLVLDADALNLLAADTSLASMTASRQGTLLMTPHPAEAARLLGVTTAAVQQDRVAAAQALAQRYRCHVLLKGNGSILSQPQGPWQINSSGNPGMASAGMGDALAGMLASLLAQGMPPHPGLQLAVWLHGAAADELVAAGRGPLGITASDVIAQARLILNRRADTTPS